jgi:hypothetical protein
MNKAEEFKELAERMNFYKTEEYELYKHIIDCCRNSAVNGQFSLHYPSASHHNDLYKKKIRNTVFIKVKAMLELDGFIVKTNPMAEFGFVKDIVILWM